MIADQFGRSFKTLRVSLLNTCNLACIYCTCGKEDTVKKSINPTLNAQELLKIISTLHKKLNFETIRLTGGEPLLYRDIELIAKGIKELGIHQLKITTNGLLLEPLAEMLANVGITSVNISLDALEDAKFFLMSKRRNMNRVLKGIEAAQNAGMKVKINSVIMKGMNDDQIIPLLNYAFGEKIIIRFLEIMRMGHLYNRMPAYFYSQEEILNTIAKYYSIQKVGRVKSSTANYWKTSEGNLFGIIANETAPFCSDCNRLRLDSEGNIYGCLSNNNPVSMRKIKDEQEVEYKLKLALSQKQAVKFTGSPLSMLQIGG